MPLTENTLKTLPTREAYPMLRCSSICLTLLLFTACDRREPTVYEVPKETRTARIPGPQSGPDSPSTATPMANRQLPADAVNPDSNRPAWTLPEGWIEAEGSAMRIATIRIPSAPSVDLSVTSFPGDVGGLLNNVNRWRRQIGLPPVGETELETMTAEIAAADLSGILAELTGPDQSTLAAIFRWEGHSWFFKMTGTSPEISAQKEKFLQYISSLQFGEPS